MKRLSLLGLTLVLAMPLEAQWTEGGASIGANLDSLKVTFQGMGTLFYLSPYGSATDVYLRDTTGAIRVSIWGDLFDGSRFYMYGPNPIILRSYSTGNDAVELPQDAIGSLEISNEAGVVSSSEGLSSVTLSGSGIDTLLFQTITAPDTGFLLIIGSAQPIVSHTNGSQSSATFGLMVDGSIPSNQDLSLLLPSSAASGGYHSPVTVHLLVPVGAGAHDVVFWGWHTSSGGTFDIYDMQLSAVYLPTAYGTVAKVNTNNVPDDQAPRRVASVPAHQIRAESQAANQARIQAELQQIRARLAELEAEMKAHETR